MEELLLSDYDFDLPKELIAQDPLEKRSDSRLLVLNKSTGRIFHDHFYNIGNYLNPGDCLVLNNTRVIPARLYGKRSTGAAIEVLLLKRLSDDTWEALTKPGKRTTPGTEILFGCCPPPAGEGDRDMAQARRGCVLRSRIREANPRSGGGGSSTNPPLKAVVESVKEDGIRIIRFIYDGIFEEILDKLGEMPLPPYITHKLSDRNRYQTVYAKNDGSAAAPTAGLHFTPELLADLESKGIKRAEVTLHVGLGTFRPVKEENALNHKMHEEYYEVSKENADIINQTRASGGRVVCVGTTSVRTLETLGSTGGVREASGNTGIFIYPGFKFNICDTIVTNFHLPKSTLLMLVSAFAGRETILKAYNEAVSLGYRFFSFGDSMIII